MKDYSTYFTAGAAPEASSMIETFRAIGYSMQTAVADIIDNAVSAGAANVWVDFDWKGSDTWLSVKDDGSGMDNAELIQAMRPGSRNPNEERSEADLGRFGLGLKTASFSQCRQLCVASKTEGGELSFWTWDLDYVSQTGEWKLLHYLPAGFEKALQNQTSGTVVIWTNLDRVVKNLNEKDNKALDKFLQLMEQVQRHLSMVFHRFLEQNKIKIFFQQHRIDAWNPFLSEHPATQKYPEEPAGNGKIKLRGFVLPHKSKLSEVEFNKAAGLKGWNSQQGFYIYRNERLLLAGDWLGLFKKEEHYKLARVRIDLPNDLDAEWQIDIKKSIARPPLILRDQLKAYAMKVRGAAVEVYRHKGSVLQRKFASVQFQPVWEERLRHGKRFYEINRKHPILEGLIASLGQQKKELDKLLKFIEETIPVSLITIKESEQPELQGTPFEGMNEEPLLNLIRQMYENLQKEGRSEEQAKAIIMNIEPFNFYPHLIEQVK